MENKFEKKLGIYCLFNKETKKYDTFMLSNSDQEAVDYFLDQVAATAYDLANKADTLNYNKLFSNLKYTCLMRVATFNSVAGSFDNEQICLIDLIEPTTIENYIKAKFELQNKFKDLVPNKEKKEGN